MNKNVSKSRMTIKQWLAAFSYQDVVDKIATVEAFHKARGSKERRDWAHVLCGTKEGNSVVIAGVEFPILASAQRSRNVQVTVDAIERNKNEEFPAPRVTGRWQKKRKLPRRARQLAKQSVRLAHEKAS
jgi:hypothetical protein